MKFYIKDELPFWSVAHWKMG